MNKLPTREQLLNPVLKALVELGGSGSVEEINEKVISDLQIPEDLTNIPHVKGKDGGQTELEYELAWTRTMLRGNGYIVNSKRGIWALVDNSNTSVAEINLPTIQLSAEQKEEIEESWKAKLQKILIEKLTPSAFERLIQRFLREKGFSQVEVTGRTGDGGIDGKGIAKINGILSFHIVFQCKKYQGAVSAGEIRDFRGAMVGRTDKGLFITTGYFTREAVKEATREGVQTIDLIDGEKLIDKLKELNLGVKVELIEKISIDEKWFEGAMIAKNEPELVTFDEIYHSISFYDEYSDTKAIETKAIIIETGRLLGFRTSIAERNKDLSYNGKKLNEFSGIITSLKNEKIFLGNNKVIKAAVDIDCIWFKNGKLMPAVMEIEHSTGVTPGLNRMQKFQKLFPPFPTRYVIVAPDEDRHSVIEKANAPQFTDLNTRFFPYSAVEELYALCQKRKLKGITEEFLDCYMEPVVSQ